MGIVLNLQIVFDNDVACFLDIISARLCMWKVFSFLVPSLTSSCFTETFHCRGFSLLGLVYSYIVNGLFQDFFLNMFLVGM